MLTVVTLICALLGLPPLALCMVVPWGETEEDTEGFFF
jgi:hypothetical protein